MTAQVEKLVDMLLEEALAQDSIEIVRQFALPIQSHTLTYLLNVPEAEAATWISWGTHVFRDGAGKQKGAALEAYLQMIEAYRRLGRGAEARGAAEQAKLVLGRLKSDAAVAETTTRDRRQWTELLEELTRQ